MNGLHAGLRAGAARHLRTSCSGGAEFAFLRMLTKGASTFKWPIRDTYGSGVVQLLSTGAPMRAQLSRTDWHAFPEDRVPVSASLARRSGS